MCRRTRIKFWTTTAISLKSAKRRTTTSSTGRTRTFGSDNTMWFRREEKEHEATRFILHFSCRVRWSSRYSLYLCNHSHQHTRKNEPQCGCVSYGLPLLPLLPTYLLSQFLSYPNRRRQLKIPNKLQTYTHTYTQKWCWDLTCGENQNININ